MQYIDSPPPLIIQLPKISELPKMSCPWSEVQLPIDVLLLTVEDHEFLSCFFYLVKPFKSYCEGIGNVYFGTVGGGHQEKMKIALIKKISKGSSVPGGSLTVVKNAFRVLQPKAVFSVGTCIGLNSENTQLGDVVVSSKLTTTEFKTLVSRRIGSIIRQVADGWIAPVENPDERQVKVHYEGDVLSAPLAASFGWRDKDIFQQYPEAIAVETEDGGCCAEAAYDHKVEWMIVKGVGSVEDLSQPSSHEWMSFASTMAASVVHNIVTDPVIFQGWPHYEPGQAMPERLLEYQSDKTRIHEGIVTRAGTIWDLRQGAAYVIFPPDALFEPTSIVVHKWKCSTRSPPLQEHEAIVSNVIEISTNANRALEFNVEVTLFLCHSAADLQGYELVLKRLVNNGNNEWEDVEGTQVLEHFSEIEDEYPSVKDVADVFPAVKAEIIECSTYAVVCRLKSSPLYTITSDGGSFNHPNYPGVLITIPKMAVPPKGKFNLQVKVQEVPSEAFDDDNVMFGPILRIACSQSVEFLKPVTIQLPVFHRDGGISQSSACRVRVLFLRSDGERKEWIEITDDLEIPPNYDGKFVRFQVERFSGYSWYSCFLD